MNFIIGLYRGRINRLQFLILLILVVLFLVFVSAILHPLLSMLGLLGALLDVVVGVAIMVFTWHIYVRRLHDFGVTGYLVLLHIFPPAIPILALVCLVAPGKSSENKYGEVPNAERKIADVFLNR